MSLMTLLKKDITKHKGSLFGILILFTVIAISLVTAFNISINSKRYIKQEMNRLGFGDITAWINEDDNLEQLSQEVENLDIVENISTQPLIFAGYSINESHSDNEGQLIAYNPTTYQYHFLNQDLNGYQNDISIGTNEIYISPAMHSMYDIAIGDEIQFDISRQGQPKTFIVKGYFEDPFIGSSMIDMKSFLVNTQDFYDLSQTIKQTSDFNVLARNGVMLHIFQNTSSQLSVTEFNREINQQTSLGQYTEFLYTQSSIYGFMLILQNIVTGFLSAFVIVLLIVSMIVMGYNITHSIELERKDMGILKTIGYTSKHLRMIQMMRYGISIVTGMLIALLCSILFTQNISLLMVTSTGLLIPSDIHYGLSIISFIAIVCIIIFFIYWKTKRIAQISPIQTIHESQSELSLNQMNRTPLYKKGLTLHIALRQLLAGKKKYIGTCVISVLLVFFLSIVGRMNTWLGPNGEGLMDAFSVANHDLGVQPMMDINMSEVENLISSYADIEEAYELAMQNVRIDGVDYTANVISDTSRFHLISGRTCQDDNEIVITEYVANDLGISIGDSVTIMHESQSADYQVVGIYQCANEMGANIGMNTQGFEKIGQANSYIWCTHYILSNHAMNDEIMIQLQRLYPIELSVHTNSWSGLDGIVDTMHVLTIGMYAIVMVFILIVIILTGSQLLYSQQRDLAIFKSIGLTSHQLRVSFALRFSIVVLIGSIIGTLMSIFLADNVITWLVKMFGIGEFHSKLGFVNSILPLLIVTIMFTVFAYLSSYKIKKVALTALINE